MGLAWWRLDMAAPAELEESLLWKLGLLGVSRMALQHPPEAPEHRRAAGLAARERLARRPEAATGAGPGTPGRALRSGPAADPLATAGRRGLEPQLEEPLAARSGGGAAAGAAGVAGGAA